MPPRVFVAYLIRNLLNGKRYVGKTSGNSIGIAIKRRWRSHLTEAKKGRGYLLHRAIRKHGAENFMIGAIGSSKTEAGAFAMERDWIARIAPEYNLSLGGEGATGVKWTEDRRRQATGRKLSDETKEKLRQIALSRSSAVKQRIYRAVRLAHCGKVVSQETRLKVSLAKKGKSLTTTGVARRSARAAGQKRYLGKPCKKGHGMLRFVDNSGCIECHRIAMIAVNARRYKEPIQCQMIS